MTSPSADQLAHVTVSMAVIRADGTVEEMGVVSETTYDGPGALARLRKFLTPRKR